MSEHEPPHPARDKIKPLEELARLTAALRADNRKVVHCHGVFDLLHIGHIRHFEQARRYGDVLVVTVTPDRFVNKGPDRPAFPEALRAESVAALAGVDYVSINQWPTAVETLHLLRPHYYAKGQDYKDADADVTGGIADERRAVEAAGGKMVFTDDILFSSSHLLNRHLAARPPSLQQYLDGVSRRYPLQDIVRYLHDARPLKVLVVGETIIDEYQYCQTMGKSGKEPILASRALHREQFAGGNLAVANHVASFSEQVTLLTCLGSRDSHEAFIRARLNAKIEPLFHTIENAPTLVKRRFVEVNPMQKLFEIYEMPDPESYAGLSATLAARLKTLLPKFDVTIVTDYGHGMLAPDVVRALCNHARFLAVNTQTNAANHGFNTISKYPRADYVCISELELHLETRSRQRDLRDVIRQITGALSCRRIVITRGMNGCVCYDPRDGFFDVPAFTSHVVDRIGAGDAVLAVTALCAQQQAPAEILGMICNAVGAQAVAIMGNRAPVERAPVIKHIEALLK